MKVNRGGVTRTAFIFKTVVIKIPNFRYSWQHFLKGLVANIHEGQTWDVISKYNPELSHLLCPVVWSSWGGWVLIMRRAKTLSETEWETAWEDEWGFIDEHKKHFPGDDTISNYGILNNKVVKIDYGQ